MTRAVLILLLGLAGCSSVTPAQQLTAACQTADSALRVAIAAWHQHKLTDAQAYAITTAGETVNAFCGAPIPPATIPAALTAVGGAVVAISQQVK